MTAHDVFVHSGMRFGIGEFGETSEIGEFQSLERIQFKTLLKTGRGKKSPFLVV